MQTQQKTAGLSHYDPSEDSPGLIRIRVNFCKLSQPPLASFSFHHP